ncbi:MAG: hypothetical protein IIY21_25400 [Clostridiales bacterium]|nr:hypothetical protein [Clostridiales bacterium]
MACYNNPCNKCNSCSKCGSSCCEHKSDCCCNLHLDWVPHTNCAISIEHDKCSDTLDLCPGIKKCQSVTHMNWNDQTGCIEYENEKYVYSDGTESSLERICVSDFLPFINLNELNDVEFDDELAGNCYELIYKKDISCGNGCKSKTDHWENWNINYPGAKVDSLEYIRGATSDGCPVYLDKPDNCALMVFSPSCVAPTGEWQAYNIPDAGSCVMEPDTNGYYHVLKKNDCGCIVECKMPIMPTGMTAINYQRDSVPDDPDFPWYYGCYNDTINLHLAQNAATYFGKYDLKITVNYGVQAIRSDRFNFNYNWRSLLVPGIVGETRRTDMEASILQNWSAVGSFQNGLDLTWGTASLRGSFTFVVPKGKEAYLHHEYRIRTTDSFPGYKLNATYDGKKVPDAETALNRALWPASRLNALQVIIEPTFGSTDFDPVKDEYRSQLDYPDDDIDQPYNL